MVTTDARVRIAFRALHNEKYSTRTWGCSELMRIGDDAVPFLLEALESENMYHRKQATWVLGKMGVDEAAPKIISLLSDKIRRVRANAVLALWRIGREKYVAELVGSLCDEHPGVRGQAAYVLGELGDSRTLNPICNMLLHEKNPRAIRMAVNALDQIQIKNKKDLRILSNCTRGCSRRWRGLIQHREDTEYLHVACRRASEMLVKVQEPDKKRFKKKKRGRQAERRMLRKMVIEA